jgi:hypothetical protein
VFAGAGVADNDALFSYHANWAAPGRWCVEILTNLAPFYFKTLGETSSAKTKIYT